jgi:hypothetical protein
MTPKPIVISGKQRDVLAKAAEQVLAAFVRKDEAAARINEHLADTDHARPMTSCEWSPTSGRSAR